MSSKAEAGVPPMERQCMTDIQPQFLYEVYSARNVHTIVKAIRTSCAYEFSP